MSNFTMPTLTPREGYRLWASSYDRELNALVALEERCLKPLLPGLAGKDVVDLACGTGRWLQYLLSCGVRFVVGIDFSEEMLAQATRRTPLRGGLVCGDCLRLPLRSSSADLVLCSLALSHLQDLGAFAREVTRIARRGADVFITDVCPDARIRGWRVTFRHDDEVCEIRNQYFTLEFILRTLGQAGLRLVSLEQPGFSEWEYPIFVARGKERLYEQAIGAPAILICHFRADWVKA
jgi:ubiquinone/menaquinone biosynthesis C-methylase UbiE